MTDTDNSTIMVAMSGGVDSSVAAALLVERGFDVIGATMKTFCYSEADAPRNTCCGLEGIADARRVCDALGVPHYVFDMEESFTRAVIDDFVDEYLAGRTPNPCVQCNSNTKIPDLLKKAAMLGADAVATGHYARIEDEADGPRILRSRDADKDQTYFLWGLPAAVLPKLRFPLGALTKSEVREYARALELATADKPESQEICFVPTDDYTDFLAQRVPAGHAALSRGEIVDTEGAVVGEHDGYARYTVGQRRGLGGGHEQRLYVIGVRPESNQVVVGTEEKLDECDIALGDLNWLSGTIAVGDAVRVQIRHGAPAVPAVVTSIDAESAQLRTDEPQRAVTPGQSGAVYRGDVLLGGGRIRSARQR